MKGILKGIGIIILTVYLFSGCAYIKESIIPTLEARESLVLTRELVDKGEISKAEEEYQSIIRRYPDSSVTGDAIFELSLLYISPRNKRKDFRKAYEGFQIFLEKYPDHQKVEIARYLVVVLKKIDSLETEMKILKDVLIRLEMVEKELKGRK